MAPVITAPDAADIPQLMEMFRVDLESLRLPADSDRLRDTAEQLIAADPDRSHVRVARSALGLPAAGVMVAHRWVSVKFSGPAFWIETLFVSKSLRRQGMGRRMVEDLIEHCRATGARGIDLESYQMNAPASYLYRSLGFRRIGRERYSFRVLS